MSNRIGKTKAAFLKLVEGEFDLNSSIKKLIQSRPNRDFAIEILKSMTDANLQKADLETEISPELLQKILSGKIEITESEREKIRDIINRLRNESNNKSV